MDISLDRSQLSFVYNRFAISKRDLSAPKECQLIQLTPGTAVSANEQGKVVFAEYESGVKVRRNLNSVMVKASDGAFWYGDSEGRWYRLD